MVELSSHELGHPQLIPMFASDERVSAHGSENSAGKEKTGNKISGGVKKSAEGRKFLGLLFKSSLRKDEIMFFVIYLVINLSYFNVCFFFKSAVCYYFFTAQ